MAAKLDSSYSVPAGLSAGGQGLHSSVYEHRHSHYGLTITYFSDSLENSHADPLVQQSLSWFLEAA